jgi:capsular polysaccharide export protein
MRTALLLPQHKSHLIVDLYKNLHNMGHEAYIFIESGDERLESELNCHDISENVVIVDSDDANPDETVEFSNHKDKHRQIVEEYSDEMALSDIESLYNAYLAKFQNYRIDTAVMWTDMRISKIAIDKLNIPTIYLENGYLPNTYQMDNQGVNCDSGLSDISYKEMTKIEPIWKSCDITVKIYHNKKSEGQLAYHRLMYLYKRYVKSDRLVMPIVEYIAKDLKSNLNRFDPEFGSSIGDDLPSNYIFIPFQVNDDTQVKYNTPNIDDMEDMLERIYEAIKKTPSNYDIVVKEHPHAKRSYRDLKQRYQDIFWLQKSFPIEKVVKNSSLVITLNSSVGFQALAKYKPVVTLGYAFYDNHPYVTSCTDLENLSQNIQHSIDQRIDENIVDDYVSSFRDGIFIDAKEKYDKHTVNYLICALEYVSDGGGLYSVS